MAELPPAALALGPVLMPVLGPVTRPAPLVPVAEREPEDETLR
jgi:hypothetical protein